MLDLRNVFLFAPIKTGYGDGSGTVTDRHRAFYDARCRHVGAVTIEPCYLDRGLREIPTQLGIDSDDKVPGLAQLTTAIQNAGARVIAHLNHPGRMTNPNIPGNYFISSTDRPCENGGATPKRMDGKDMDQVRHLFADAARRAHQAGFDIIELQFGHGYLPAQFLSPFVNDRDDEYGGSFENRVRFPLEILDTVQNSVNLPIIVRISGDEMLSRGIQLPEMIAFSKLLEKRGVSAVHVSAGSVCSTPPWYFQHMFVPKGKTWDMARQMKKDVTMPVIAVGQINTPEDVDTVRRDYGADYVALGRALVADPDFVGKYLGIIQGPIIPCLACAEGCLGGVKSGQGLQCLVNPEVGQETTPVSPAARAQRYAVVGGGPAGMEASIVLQERGHIVDLYEKEQLGGQFIYAPLTPNKRSLSKLIPYMTERLTAAGVTVIMKEATEADLVSRYDGVILATGSRVPIPEIPGLDRHYWAEILLEENVPENKNVLIIGGGLVGVDIATALIPRNNRITIVKRTTDFGEDMEMIAKKLSLAMMREKGTVFSDHTHITGIDGKTVHAERNGEPIAFTDIDVIVVSTGMKSYDPLADGLTGKIPVFTVGDANAVGNAHDAIRDGYRMATVL